MSQIILQDVADQTVQNTTTETNVFVGTVPGGTWIGRMLLIEQTGRYQNNNQNARSFTIRLYVGSSSGSGGTKVSEFTQTTGASTLGHGTVQRWELYAIDADSLRVVQRFALGGPGSDGGSFTAQTNPGSFLTKRQEGLSGLDGDTEIRITVQLSATGTNHRFDSRGVWIPLIDEASTESDLVIQDASHGHAADNLALTQVHSLVLADASHAHTADNLTLTQVHVLAISDGHHGLVSDNLTLAAGGDATLVTAKGSHSHAADNLVLTQVHNLAVSDGHHALVSDNLTLTQVHVLQINDGHHALTSDVVGLVLPVQLVIQDGHHSLTSDQVSFAEPLIISQDGPIGGGAGAGDVLVLSHEGPG